MKFLMRGIRSTTVCLRTNVNRKHICLITDRGPLLKFEFYLSAIRIRHSLYESCCIKSAYTLSEAIYIRSDVCPIMKEARALKK